MLKASLLNIQYVASTIPELNHKRYQAIIDNLQEIFEPVAAAMKIYRGSSIHFLLLTA